MHDTSIPNSTFQSGPNRVALVTGASAGIGTAVAKEFVDRGHAVGIMGRSVERLEEVRRWLESAGGRVVALPGDLADLAFAESAVCDSTRCAGISSSMIRQTIRQTSSDLLPLITADVVSRRVLRVVCYSARLGTRRTPYQGSSCAELALQRDCS